MNKLRFLQNINSDVDGSLVFCSDSYYQQISGGRPLTGMLRLETGELNTEMLFLRMKEFLLN
jgi:hypothetical protein